MSYVAKAGLNTTDSITEARLVARLTVEDCIELCDISERTWYRWLKLGAPQWAVRLVLSQQATLDRFGWKDWEIRDGALYWNQLHYRYFWTPERLVLPLYNVRDSDIPWQSYADNLSAIEVARRARSAAQVTDSPADAHPTPPSRYAHNI